MELTKLAKEIIASQQSRKLTVRQVITNYEMQYIEEAADHLRRKMSSDVAEFIVPKLEIQQEGVSDLYDGKVFRGQVYVYSKSEFEELVDMIERKILEELKPKFTWGDTP